MSNINDDYSRIAVVHSADMEWRASPSPEVWRKRLELYGEAEAGRVTSVVRYAAGSRFPSHAHPEGEEFFVLTGTFSDQYGDYPAGTYVLNPDGSEHAPFSNPGCELLVKLRQYPGPSRPRVVIDTTQASWRDHSVPGISALPLYDDDTYPEKVRLVRFQAGISAPTQSFPAGEEIFVVDGEFADEHGQYRTGSWVRYPAGSSHTPRSNSGCVLYVKKGHLAERS